MDAHITVGLNTYRKDGGTWSCGPIVIDAETAAILDALDKAERERDSLQSILDDQVVLANALGALLHHPYLSEEAIRRTLRARRQRHRDRLEGR